MNPKFSVCCKKISINGEILQNTDYGVGYTVVWEKDPIINNESRTRVVPMEMIALTIEQLNFLDKSNCYNAKNQQAVKKLMQAIQILQK